MSDDPARKLKAIINAQLLPALGELATSDAARAKSAISELAGVLEAFKTVVVGVTLGAQPVVHQPQSPPLIGSAVADERDSDPDDNDQKSRAFTHRRALDILAILEARKKEAVDLDLLMTELKSRGYSDDQRKGLRGKITNQLHRMKGKGWIGSHGSGSYRVLEEGALYLRRYQ